MYPLAVRSAHAEFLDPMIQYSTRTALADGGPVAADSQTAPL